MSATYEVRETRPEEWRTAADVVGAALLFGAQDDEAWEQSVASWEGSDSVSAWDGARCIGHAAGYRFDTVVPGGTRLATSGVSRVGVATDARRRGVASALMTRLLRDARARGQVLASLRASEAVIYGRWGFGVAGTASEIRFTPRDAGTISGVASGTCRTIDAGDVLDVVPALYEAVRGSRNGSVSRPEHIWRRYLEDALKRGGKTEMVVVHRDPDGADDGFVHYGVRWEDAPFDHAAGVGEIHDLWAASPGVELALWAYLRDVDLVRTWTAFERPVDDIIRVAAANHRSYTVRLGAWDEQWLRLLDVDAALRARSYRDAADSITIAVHDELLDENRGVWALSADGAKRLDDTHADADLRADVAVLAAAYLGGSPWTALADAGFVDVGAERALDVADQLFATRRAPFCGSFF